MDTSLRDILRAIPHSISCSLRPLLGPTARSGADSVSARAIWIVGLAAVLAALATLNLWRTQPSGSAVEPVSRSSPTSEPARPSGSLAAPLAEDARETPQPEVAGHAPRAEAPTEPNGAAPLLPTQSAATPLADILAARGMPALPELLETERTFAAEPRDPEWSTAAESHILGKLAEIPGTGLTTLEVECRQTLCRLQFTVPRTAAEGPPSAEELARLRAGPQIPGIAELVRATGLNGRWVFGLSPVSMAYLERAEVADAAAAPR
jgi:hypothetical protein